MISETVQYWVNPEFLRQEGPHIRVVVAGKSDTLALLDTGADMSIIDNTFAQSIQLVTAGTHYAAGATASGTFPRFRADLHIPTLDVTVPSPLHGFPLKRQGIPWNAIIGRDVLCQFEMTINGKNGLIRFTP